MRTQTKTGFTLAELLIALAILGVIAVWTIPKLLVTQQNQQYKATAREIMGMVTSGAQFNKLKNGPGDTMPLENLTQYMNYVSLDTTSEIDLYQNGATISCADAAYGCLKLHHGGIVLCEKGNYLLKGWLYDPDEKVTDGTTNGPGKSVYLVVGNNERFLEIGEFGAMLGDPSFRQYTPPWYSDTP